MYLDFIHCCFSEVAHRVMIVTPQSWGPINNLSTCGIPVDFGLLDTTWLCPIYRDPYFHKKSDRVSFVQEALPNIQPV